MQRTCGEEFKTPIIQPPFFLPPAQLEKAAILGHLLTPAELLPAWSTAGAGCYMAVNTLGFYSRVFLCIDSHLCRPEPKASANATPEELGSCLAVASQGTGCCSVSAACSRSVGCERVAPSRYGRTLCTPACSHEGTWAGGMFGREVLSGRTHSGTDGAGNTWAPEPAEGRIKKEVLKIKAKLL